MIEQARLFCRRHLPDSVRKPLGNCFGFIGHKILHPISGLLFDLSGGRYRTDACTFVIPKNLTTRSYRSCFLRDTYEREERELIKQCVRPSDSVLELGACLGVVSCVTNRLLADKSRHVVVEANPLLIPCIHRNRQLNDAGFLVEHCAVSNKREETFYLHPVYIVGGTAQRKTDRPVRLPGRSLRELHERYGPFSVLIIDVEGSEREVFESSRDILATYRLVIAELHAWAIGEEGVEWCRSILADTGLRCVDRAGITEAWQRE